MTTTNGHSPSDEQGERDMRESATGSTSLEKAAKPRVSLSKKNLGDEFANLDISPDFKSITQPGKPVRDEFEIALTGPAYFKAAAPKKTKQQQDAEKPEADQPKAAPAKSDLKDLGSNLEERSAALAPKREKSKLLMIVAAVACVVTFVIAGIQSFSTETANQVTFDTALSTEANRFSQQQTMAVSTETPRPAAVETQTTASEIEP